MLFFTKLTSHNIIIQYNRFRIQLKKEMIIVNTETYIEFIPKFLNKLENDGVSSDTMGASKWITSLFKDYCLKNNIDFIDMEVIKNFYKNQLGLDIKKIECNVHCVVRRPLLILMEYYNTGTYLKSHFNNQELSVPDDFSELFSEIKNNYIDKLNISADSRIRKSGTILNFFLYLNNNSISKIDDITIEDVSKYINYVNDKYAPETLRTIKGILREIINWLYSNKKINFTGNQVFPVIRKNNKNKILTTYTEDEISKILNSIDINSKNGKCKYAIISLLVYYGLRAGDILNLKFENIDFQNNSIKLVQQKTKKYLCLPLIDNVKISLLDYIKNERHDSIDKDYIFITMKAPYTKIKDASSIYYILTSAMDKAGIDYNNKKHGPHSLRHSLATNMINENIPLEDISSILGHESTSTTNIYITKDTTHLRELTLEIL